MKAGQDSGLEINFHGEELSQLGSAEVRNGLFINCVARIAQLVAYHLGTGEVQGSNPGKGKNF